MSNHGFGPRARRLIGAFLIVDGVLAATLGRTYVRVWECGPESRPYRRAIGWLARRPPWLIRVAGLLEASVGIGLLGTAPVSVPELYAATADIYDQIETVWRDWLYGEGHRAFDVAMAAHLPAGGDVLDLGCGTGANLVRLSHMGQPFSSYTGVDLSEEMLARARCKGEGQENVRFLQLDLQTDTLPEGPYDLVVSTWVIEHLANPDEVVRKAWQRLRPGGDMILFFEISTGFWWGQMVDHLLRFLSARHVPEEIYLKFPGLAAVSRYRGLFGDVALVTLHKPHE